MAKKKPETLGFGNTELRDAVLKLIDDGSTRNFNAAFAHVMHARGIFHRKDQETYNSWFRRIHPLVTTALNVRKLKEQRAMRPPKKASPKKEFARFYHQGRLSGFTPELAEFD